MIGGYFGNFGQVKNWWFFFLTLSKSKTHPTVNSLRKNWMPEQFSRLLVHATGTPPWLLIPVKVSTSSELYTNYFWLSTFLDCSGIQFFDSSLSQHSQLGYLWLLTPHSLPPVLLTGCYAMPVVTWCFPSNPYQWSRGFP